MTTPTELRGNPRYETSLPVRVTPPEGEPILGSMLNMGRGGVLVALPVELVLERTYRIEITDSHGVFRLHGEALRLHLPRRDGNGAEAALFKVGFEFVGTDAETSQRLDPLLAGVSGGSRRGGSPTHAEFTIAASRSPFPEPPTSSPARSIHNHRGGITPVSFLSPSKICP